MMDGSGNSLSAGPESKKKKVTYFYDPEVGNYYYGEKHPMKPHRIRLTHELVKAYNMDEKMQVLVPPKATDYDMRQFHSDDYVDFLQTVAPDLNSESTKAMQITFLCSPELEDCPNFYGLYSFCQISAGGSIEAAKRLSQKDAEIAINWAGGLHHAKRGQAKGFCYVNDIVLAILELLKSYQRVLYVDIDVHHGDGVEEAFYLTDRVMTVSFHKYGDNFFPETGTEADIGFGKGMHYAVNVPLQDGIDDNTYHDLFKTIMSKVMEKFDPEAIVLQCGADSLAGDLMGPFNLSVKGHAECVKYMRSFNVPLLLLGGGGYTINNVARCWCYETAVALDIRIEGDIPDTKYLRHYDKDFSFHLTTPKRKNYNNKEEIESLKSFILRNLQQLPHRPSVPFHERPPNLVTREETEIDMEE